MDFFLCHAQGYSTPLHICPLKYQRNINAIHSYAPQYAIFDKEQDLNVTVDSLRIEHLENQRRY